MADDESRNEHLPTEGDEIFTENGSETVENDQTGLPPWAAAITAQLQKVFTEQLEGHIAAQAQANREELQELIEECRFIFLHIYHHQLGRNHQKITLAPTSR